MIPFLSQKVNQLEFNVYSRSKKKTYTFSMKNVNNVNCIVRLVYF